MRAEEDMGMLEEMIANLEKLAEVPYEEIRDYESKTRKLKEVDFNSS